MPFATFRAVAMSEGGETTSAFHFTPDHSGTWTVWLATDDRGSRILGKAEVEISDEGVSNNDVLRFVSMTVENRTNSMIYGNCAQGKVTVVKCNVDDCEDIAVQYGIRSIPTLIYFKDGQVVDKSVGLVQKADIVAKLNTLL